MARGQGDPAEEAEIVVVGAGPAGSTAAAALAELGHEVLLIDKNDFPREKPCGDGIMFPAVTQAERLGLNAMIEDSVEIEATRVVVGHRRQTAIRYEAAPDRPLPRCITRADFDAGLLSAARQRGSRFLRAQVEGIEETGRERWLRARDGEESIEVRAGLVIAADGATSRIRRVLSGGTEKPAAYAIRQYFRVERPLDPVFQIDVPLEFEGRILPGYGWVFPIDEHTANIGVGALSEPHHRLPSLRKVLAAYVTELQVKAARRFGDLEASGEPLGSPMGIRSQLEVAGAADLALVGDAAGSTHPITGEGISFAMCAGNSLAGAVHNRLRRGGQRANGAPIEAQVWRAFPQLGIDTSALSRASMLELNKSPGATKSIGSVSEPFLAAARRFACDSAYETGVEATPAWIALDRCDPALAIALQEANDLLLERLSDHMPFVTETIHASIRGHLGPMYAAVVLATATTDGTPPDGAFEAGVAAEAVGVLPELLTMLVDRVRSKRLQANNAMAVLTGDFAATRALLAAAKLGPAAVTALAHACRNGCQGGMRDSAGRFAADREVESWLAAAQETAGSATVLAAQLGTMVGAGDPAPEEALRRFGLELGTAIRLAEEIVDLTIDNEIEGADAGAKLQRGIYSLPVLYAIEAEPSLPRLLARHSAEQDGAEEILATIRESSALERAVEECAERSAAAQSLAQDWSGDALASLAGAPGDYVASQLALGAVETS